ncbi:MAG TPA: hypothetical protein VGA98_10825, partial [Allosphingosinicella sp.]
GDGSPFPIDLFKVPHHGSQANVTRELLAALDCTEFLISTDGSRFGHPDEIAIARLITSGPGAKVLHFNYRQQRTSVWEERENAQQRHTYICRFPDDDESPLIINL